MRIMIILFLQIMILKSSFATCNPTPRTTSFFEEWLPGVSLRTTRDGQNFLERNSKFYPLRTYKLPLPKDELFVTQTDITVIRPSAGTAMSMPRYEVNYTTSANPLGCDNFALLGRAPKDFEREPTDGWGNMSRESLRDNFYYEWTLCEKKSKSYCKPYDPGVGKNRIKLAIPWKTTIAVNADTNYRDLAICDAVVNRLSWMIYNLADKRQREYEPDSLIWKQLDVVKTQISLIDYEGTHFLKSKQNHDNGLSLCRAKLTLLADKFLYRSNVKEKSLIKNPSTKFPCSDHKLLSLSRCLAIHIDLRNNPALREFYESVTELSSNVGFFLSLSPALKFSGKVNSSVALLVNYLTIMNNYEEGNIRLSTQRFVVDQSGTLADIGFIDKHEHESEKQALIEEKMRLNIQFVADAAGLVFEATDINDFFKRAEGELTTPFQRTALGSLFSNWRAVRVGDVAQYHLIDRNIKSIANQLIKNLDKFPNKYSKLKRFIEKHRDIINSHITHNAETQITDRIKDKSREALLDMIYTFMREGIIIPKFKDSYTEFNISDKNIQNFSSQLDEQKRLVCEKLKISQNRKW